MFDYQPGISPPIRKAGLHASQLRYRGRTDPESTVTQREIVEPSPLLDSHGELQQVGWARQPLLDCNLGNARTYRAPGFDWTRLKRWDYYGVTHPTGYFSATIAHLGYAGQVFVYTVDFERATYAEDTITIPLGSGVELARNSDSGSSSWRGEKASLAFDVVDDARQIVVKWNDFGGQRLSADLSMSMLPDHESTVIVIPIGDRRFYYNRKINSMPVTGTVSVGDETTELAAEASSGNLDWGRGIWEYNSTWVWASASGFLGGSRRVGLNLGFGFGDTSAATENTLFIDGKIHKLGDVTFEYDKADFMKPWRMRSDRVDLTFTPFLDRTAKTNLLLIRSEVHQMFGHYEGTVAEDSGSDVQISGLVGWAEEHQARW